MALHPKLDIQVAYCSLQGAQPGLDREFGIEVAWDVPLLEGYRWMQVPNRSCRPGLGRFFGLVNPGLWKLVRAGKFDVVVSYTGYAYLSFWILAAAAKLGGVPLLASTDAHSLRSPNPKWWKSLLKRYCLPRLYRLFDVVLAPSEATIRFIESLGISSERIILTPCVVDNDWWAKRADLADRPAIRTRFGISEKSLALLYCAKLQPWKRPQDLLRAFARLGSCDCFLIFAGEGPLRHELEAEAKTLGVSERVLFPGFVNQSQLPEMYRAADVFVLPSEYDGCPLVVCEAMACGCPVILSDAVPGRFDIVRHGVSGFIYPCRNVEALTSILREILSKPERLQRLAAGARQQIETWSPHENVEGHVQAFERAIRLKPIKAQA
jgi:glycosyltransferase involved in cell wall biosynthesis